MARMRRVLSSAHQLLQACGWRPRQTLSGLRALPWFVRDLIRFRALSANSPAQFSWGALHPCLHDLALEGGVARGQYFHQDLLVARRIFEAAPREHFDVGSRIDGFIAHLAVFRPVNVLDIRPVSPLVRNIRFVQADFMSALPSHLVECCDSLSCLHAIEHFGLGRYGDRLDPEGHIKGLHNLHQMLAPGGRLYLSAPMGPQRIEFNGHRVFSLRTLLDLTADLFHLERFSFVDDKGDLHEDHTLDDESIATHCSCIGGCGIFELVKKPPPPGQTNPARLQS
jgi:SAM-dependent methyltransferase